MEDHSHKEARAIEGGAVQLDTEAGLWAPQARKPVNVQFQEDYDGHQSEIAPSQDYAPATTSSSYAAQNAVPFESRQPASGLGPYPHSSLHGQNTQMTSYAGDTGLYSRYNDMNSATTVSRTYDLPIMPRQASYSAMAPQSSFAGDGAMPPSSLSLAPPPRGAMAPPTPLPPYPMSSTSIPPSRTLTDPESAAGRAQSNRLRSRASAPSLSGLYRNSNGSVQKRNTRDQQSLLKYSFRQNNLNRSQSGNVLDTAMGDSSASQPVTRQSRHQLSDPFEGFSPETMQKLHLAPQNIRNRRLSETFAVPNPHFGSIIKGYSSDTLSKMGIDPGQTDQSSSLSPQGMSIGRPNLGDRASFDGPYNEQASGGLQSTFEIHNVGPPPSGSSAGYEMRSDQYCQSPTSMNPSVTDHLGYPIYSQAGPSDNPVTTDSPYPGPGDATQSGTS